MIAAIFLALFLMQSPSMGRETTSTYVDADDTLNDKIFTKDILFDVRARSPLDCSRLCLNAESCTSSTYYTTETGLTSCRGHSQAMTSISATAAVVGARTSVRKGASRCPVSSGFVLDAGTGMCYRAYHDMVNLSSAVATCEGQGGTLITLDTENKMAALVTGGQPKPLTMYWIGLRPQAHPDHDCGTDARCYVWTRTGESLDADATVTNAFTSDCAVIIVDSRRTWLAGWPCDQTIGVLCEIA